jgi:hypothetical protein
MCVIDSLGKEELIVASNETFKFDKRISAPHPGSSSTAWPNIEYLMIFDSTFNIAL